MRPFLRKLCLSAAVSALSISLFAGSALAATGSSVAWVNFRSAPSTSSTVVGSLRPGTSFEILQVVNSYWLKVSVNGKTGYVSSSSKYVSFSVPSEPKPPVVEQPAPSLANQIVSYALGFQGKVKYKYGVRDRNNLILDCSSFTEMVFEYYGVQLPWGSKAQSKLGTFVGKSVLQPGDLVFFSTSGSGGAIAHVGIYVGNGKFVNNLPGSGVIVSDINSSWWSKHYITARRVL